jgi:hypothetical protein
MQAPSVSSRGLTLRADLDAPPRWMPRPRPATLAIVLLSALMAHLVLWGGARVHLPRLGGGKHGAPRMTVRKALDEIRRVHKKPMSKEAAAALVEKAILDVFGDLDDSSNASERERAARAVLDDVRFLRYAPQLGDYTQKIRDVAARAMSVIRRWA